MAGGGSLSVEKREKRGSFASKRKKPKRVSFVLDMTPLVDIAFLLLTFFMFTTTMNQPKVMEMSIPPDNDSPVDVPESKLFSLLVRGDGDVFWYKGLKENADYTKVQIEDLKKLVVNANMVESMRNELIMSLAISRKASYTDMIEVLDVLELSETDIIDMLNTVNISERKRKFALVPMDEDEEEEIDKLP